MRRTRLLPIASLLVLVACSRGSRTAEQPESSQALVGTWRLVSWTKSYEDGSKAPEPRSESYLMYTDTGHMCWCAVDPARPSWPQTPTEADELAAFRGLGMYCGTVEVNADQGYVVHHVEISRSPNAVGDKRKRFFRFEGPDRLHLRVDPTENVPPLVESVLIWEKVK